MSYFELNHDCEGCGKENSTSRMDRICPACREALEVGRLVMSMKPGQLLMTPDEEYATWSVGNESDKYVNGQTCLEALRKAVKHG